MKWSKQLISTLLAIVLILSAFPPNAFAYNDPPKTVSSNSSEQIFLESNEETLTGYVTEDARYWLYDYDSSAELQSAIVMTGTSAYDKDFGYYSQLTRVQKDIYDAFVEFFITSNGLCSTNTGTMIYTPATDSYIVTSQIEVNTDTSRAYFAFSYDYPQVFWTGGYSAEYIVSSSGTSYNIKSISFNFTEKYPNAKKEIADYNAALSFVADDVMVSVTEDSEYGYYRAIHDWMCRNMSYNHDSLVSPSAHPRAHSSAGVFIGNGSVVCQGYGETFKVLCDYIRRTYGSDLYSAMIIGSATEKKDHMWNYAYMPDGKWYAVDVCWDDQDSGMRDTYFMVGKNSPGFHDTFSNEHTEDNQLDTRGLAIFSYPVINNEKYVVQSKPLVSDGTFTYLNYNDQAQEYTYHYDESWFNKTSYEYQHDLVKMSLRVAMAAGDLRAAKNETYTDGASSLKNLMDNLGFEYSEQYSHYPVPEYDSIGYGIGSKEITSSSGEKSTLIMVAVRGFGYAKEWGGNFRVGTGTDHEGFRLAANQVLSGIENYMEANGESFHPDVKIWISGYSRAAATTNLVAADLVDGYITGLEPENIYAFCFECPQNTTSSSVNASRYANIVNIVNPLDLVPKVAMSAWGFNRYGTTYYLPSAETFSQYAELKQSMENRYRDIISYINVGNALQYAIISQLISEKSGQSSALDQLCDWLAEAFVSPNYYSKWLQDDFVPVLSGILHQPSVAGVLRTICLVPKLPIQIGYALEKIEMVGGVDFGAVGFNAHYPELCLAWLDSLDGLHTDLYIKTAGGFRKAFINCPVDVTVYDSTGRLVAKIENDTVCEIENGIGAYIDFNGQKVIVLPTDEEYDVQLSATDDGTMTYTVTEYSLDTAETQRVVSYHEIEITEGDQLTGTVENLEDVSAAQYPLSLADGSEAEATIDQTGEEVISYHVEVSASSGGMAIGGGTFVSGEHMRATATPDEGYRFDGWYLEDEKVSNEIEQRFIVSKDMDITARFSQLPVEYNAEIGTLLVPDVAKGTHVIAAAYNQGKMCCSISGIGDGTGDLPLIFPEPIRADQIKIFRLDKDLQPKVELVQIQLSS